MTASRQQSSALIMGEPFNITCLSNADKSAWDHYVEHHPDGSFFHLFGWGEVVKSAYGYEPIYLAAQRGGHIVGLALFVDVRAPLLGRSLISTAFTVGGGPIGDDQSVIDALGRAVVKLGEERNVQYIEARADNFALDGWQAKSGKHAEFQLSIPADEGEHLNIIPRKRRADLRKALAAADAKKLQLRYDNDVDSFYALYARSLRQLGTPVMPKHFLQELVRVFAGQVEISFIDHEGDTVAGLFSFHFKSHALPYYVGTAPGAHACRAHDYLYWAAMRRAVSLDCPVFDFGRSKIDSGAYQYKKLWGAAPHPVSYQYRLIRARTAPDVNPNNPKFRYFSRTWKKLPLPLANVAGPFLAPNFP